MNDSALAILNPGTLETLDKLSTNLAQSALIPDELRGKPRDVLVILMTGAELGLSPMKALRSISVIKGKPQLSADLMVALVKQATDVCEYLTLDEFTNERATYTTKRRGAPKPVTMSFSIDDARRAGLLTSNMYTKYPKQMLRARCASLICKAEYSDLTMGLYDSDSGELTDGKPLERDITPAQVVVTPAPALPTPTPPTAAQALDAVVEARVVEAQAISPASRTAQVRAHVEAFTKVKLPEAYERIRALGERYGVTGKALSKVVKASTGKTKAEYLEEEDVDHVHNALQAEQSTKAKGYVNTATDVVDDPSANG